MEDPKVKKYLALLLALVMVFALAACGSTAETPAATEAPAAEPETPAEEPAAEADPMEDLIAAAKARTCEAGTCRQAVAASPSAWNGRLLALSRSFSVARALAGSPETAWKI